MTRPSIRDRLESDAWNRYPETARRIAGFQKPARRRNTHRSERYILLAYALLVIVLILRIETAHAEQDPFWGIEFHSIEHSLRAVAFDTEVTAEITGLLARVEVTQRFRNTESGWAEAVYRYPLPEGAAVDRMRVTVGERVLQGEIREKEDARRIYTEARDEGKVASLVEQARANQFETRLANIAAGEEITVSIGFLAGIDFRDGVFSLAIPMTSTPRWDPGQLHAGGQHRFIPADATDAYRLTLDILLRTPLPLSSLESRYHDIDIAAEPDGYRIFLADPDTRTDRVFELAWAPELGNAPQSALMSWDGGDAVYALMMLAPPIPEAIAPRAREVVFIIDTSGSMEGAPLEQAVAALAQGLTFLEPEDRFNLVEFNSRFRPLFDESVSAMPWRITEATEFLLELEADGGTNMAPALDYAMTLPARGELLRQIVFITDGSVGNERELLLEIGEKLGDSRLFTVSIGSAPNAWFMRKAAGVGRGIHTHVGRMEDVKARIASLWTRIETPAVQNLDVEWGMDAEFYPEVIPDLYAGEPLWLYARLPHEPRDVTVSGELDGGYWDTRARLAPGGGGENIASLWARNRIEALEDSRIFGIDADEVRQQVVATALEFGLVARYTSLVAVDRTPSRPVHEDLAQSDVPSLLPAGSNFVMGFSQTATGWPAQLALSLLSLFVVLAMLLHTPPKRERRTTGSKTENPEVGA